MMSMATSTGAIAVITDMTSRIEAEQQRLQHAQQQRDVLIREVHHRIKNNLQGVVGLLRQHITEIPGFAQCDRARDRADPFHGGGVMVCRAMNAVDELRLCDMLTAICGRRAMSCTPRHVPVVDIEMQVPVCVDKLEAVPDRAGAE